MGLITYDEGVHRHTCLIDIEVIEQSRDRGEGITLLKVAIMPMVSFSRLIVISENTEASLDQNQPVFERMQAARQHPRQPPNHDLGE